MRKIIPLLFALLIPCCYAQTNMGPINTPQVNSTLYVGSLSGSQFYPTIQSAVTSACASGAKRVVDIPPAYTGVDPISGVTGGCTNTTLRDEHAGLPVACYTWQTSVYSSSGVSCANSTGGSTGSPALTSLTTTTLQSGLTGLLDNGGITLPDGNVLIFWQDSTGTYSQVGTVSAGVVTGWGTKSAITPPSGYTFFYFSGTIIGDSIFGVTSLVSNSTGQSTAAYLIGTIGGSDVITWGPPTTTPIAGQNYVYVPNPAVVKANGQIVIPLDIYLNEPSSNYPIEAGIEIGTYSSSWSFGPLIVVGSSANDPITPSDGFNESALLVYPNGDILDVMRGHLYGNVNDGVGSYASSLSHDGGLTWTAPEYSLNVNFVGNPRLWLDGNKTLLIGRMGFLNATNQSYVSYTGGAISMDEGVSFATPPSNLGVISNSCYEALFSVGGNIGMTQCSGTNTLSYTTVTTQPASQMNLYYPQLYINFANVNGMAPNPFQTNGTTNASQTALNLKPSTVNAVGLTVTPTNTGTNQETFEITGGSYAGNAATATNVAYSGLTGTVPTWNQNTTGTAANITATSNSTLTTLPSLSLPYSQVSGTPTLGNWAPLNYPVWSSGTPFVKMTAAGTFALDSNTYLTSLSGALLATGATTGATSQAQVFTNGIIPSNLTVGYLPYAESADKKLINSPVFTDGTNVGIGTTSPSERLDVSNAGSGSGISINSLGDYDTHLTLNYRGANSSGRDWGLYSNYTAYGDLEFRSNTSNGGAFANSIMTLQSTGNVSIGDTTATSMFNVGTANQFQVTSSGVMNAAAGSTVNSTAICLANGTGCPVAGGSVSLGGALSCSNLSFGTGAGTSPTCRYVNGYDSNFTVGITTGSSPSTSPGVVFTITFTTTRGHNSACTMTPLIQSIYSSLAQIPSPEASGGGGGTATNIGIGSPATALAAATSYDFNINCP